jgi:hypothetical protein
MSEFGINLGFAIKRWPDPAEWAAVVRHELELDLVQFSFDLLNPWWPDCRRLARGGDNGVRRDLLRSRSAWPNTHNGPHRLPTAVDERPGVVRNGRLGANAMGGPVVHLGCVLNPAGSTRRRAGIVETLRDLAEARGEGSTHCSSDSPSARSRRRSSRPSASRCLGGSAVRFATCRHETMPLSSSAAEVASRLTPLAASVVASSRTRTSRATRTGLRLACGCVDLGAFAAGVEAGGLLGFLSFSSSSMPALEAADSDVIARVRTSVDHCRANSRTGSRQEWSGDPTNAQRGQSTFQGGKISSGDAFTPGSWMIFSFRVARPAADLFRAHPDAIGQFQDQAVVADQDHRERAR